MLPYESIYGRIVKWVSNSKMEGYGTLAGGVCGVANGDSDKPFSPAKGFKK